MKKIKINEKMLSIYTAVIYIISIILFEIGYCNSENFINLLNNKTVNYNFSLCRIVMYCTFIILFWITKKSFTKEVKDLENNKIKKIFMYISIMATPIILVTVIFIAILYIPQYVKVLTIGMLAVLMANICIIYLSNNILKNVIIISFTIGMVFTITTKFNHPLDEIKHFKSAFNTSLGNFNFVKHPITDTEIDKLPNWCRPYSSDEFLKGHYEPNLSTDIDMDNLAATPAAYNPIMYSFSAIGILIARILRGSIVDIYIMGRLFNLIGYTILMCLTMKILPYKKNIFLTMFFLPMSLVLAASYSIDGLCIAIVSLFIAYCLKLKNERKTLTLKDCIILGVMLIILLLVKSMGYISVALIIFTLPLIETLKKNKKHLKKIIFCLTIIFLILIGLVIYTKNTKVVEDARGGSNISVQGQINNIINNPITFVRVMLIHLRDSLFNMNWYGGLNNIAYFTKNSGIVFIPLTLFILYVAITEDDYNFKIKDKIIMILAYLGFFFMTSLVLYLAFVPVGAWHIEGVQIRYMIPVFSLILMGLSSNKLKSIEIGNNRNFNIALICMIFDFIGLLAGIVA